MALTTLTKQSSKTLLWKTLPSLNLLQTFKLSTTTQNPTPNSTTTTNDDPSKKPKRKKKKTLFDVAKFLPNWGLGYHMTKSHWTNLTYEITKINLYKSGNHGKAWGLAYKDGLPCHPAKKISGVNKRCWKYIRNPIKLEAPKPESQEAPKPESQEAPKPELQEA